MRTTITANGTGFITTTPDNHNNLYVFVDAAATLGGGTLSIGVRDFKSSDSLFPIDTAMPAGAQNQYPVGGHVELHYTLSGATTPSVTLMVTTGM